MTDKSYWMIEKQIDGRAHWWCSLQDGDTKDWNAPNRWITDATKARHFDEEWEAKFVMGREMKKLGCVATGHIDI